MIVKSRADADGGRIVLQARASAARPAFLARGEFPNRAGGADRAAQRTTGRTVAGARDQHRGPKALHTGFAPGGLERVVGTHLQALAAADAARQESGFLQRAGGTQRASLAFGAQHGGQRADNRPRS